MQRATRYVLPHPRCLSLHSALLDPACCTGSNGQCCVVALQNKVHRHQHRVSYGVLISFVLLGCCGYRLHP
jgi:hypothetical protein